jgi:hypothetical protein
LFSSGGWTRITSDVGRGRDDFPLAEVGNDFCSSGGWEEEKAKEYIFSSAEAGGELNLKWDEAEAFQTAEAGNEVNSNTDKAEAETFSPAEAGTRQRPSRILIGRGRKLKY